MGSARTLDIVVSRHIARSHPKSSERYNLTRVGSMSDKSLGHKRNEASLVLQTSWQLKSSELSQGLEVGEPPLQPEVSHPRSLISTPHPATCVEELRVNGMNWFWPLSVPGRCHGGKIAPLAGWPVRTPAKPLAIHCQKSETITIAF